MDANKVRTGNKLLINGEPYLVLTYGHRKMKRGAKAVIKMRNLLTGSTIEETYDSGDNLDTADITYANAQYLYDDGEKYYFMDNEDFEQHEFTTEKLGDTVKYLVEDLQVMVMKWNGEPINVELPPTVSLAVAETMPGVKGDTATGGTKPATLESGLVVQVPLFIEEGEKLVINTETGEYRERAK